MPTLGDMLASARHAGTIARWLTQAEPELATALSQAAGAAGTTPDGFARIAVADFTNGADEEAWTKLLSRLRGARDPGLACLGVMVRWRLSRDRAAAEPRPSALNGELQDGH
jgi:hypothetical protein